jgi:hypothetical protein
MRLLLFAGALAALSLAGCGERRAAAPAAPAPVPSPPLPTKQTTIDPVMQRLDAASALEQERRAKMEEATKQ